MDLSLINKTRTRLPQAFLEKWVNTVSAQLQKRGFPKSLKGKTLTIVFLDKKSARSINKQFRGKDYATDVLSFDPIEPDSLGELVLCPEVLKAQAKEHGLAYQMELGYMVLHGILHLLGFEHEETQEKAEEMFGLQDEIFDAISIRYVNSRRPTHRKKKNRRS